jgi:hypothetical protein
MCKRRNRRRVRLAVQGTPRVTPGVSVNLYRTRFDWENKALTLKGGRGFKKAVDNHNVNLDSQTRESLSLFRPMARDDSDVIGRIFCLDAVGPQGRPGWGADTMPAGATRRSSSRRAWHAAARRRL